MTRTIGSYEVVERRRGRGERYVLRQGDDRFACRVIEMPAEADVIEQAEREVRVVGSIEHPALSPIREVFADQGKLVIVWPETVGEVKTLGSLIAASALPPAAAWWVGAQLGGLLAQSHSAEDGDDFLTICHGHIEPSLVEVSRDGQVRLLGLGLAPLVGHGLVPNQTFTAPEQRSGGRVTPRGDLYSIAVLLWSMLTGTVPIEGPTIDEVRDAVPDTFHEAFARALEPKVSRRKITAMEFEQWLTDLSAGGQAALSSAVATLLDEEQAARDEASGAGLPRRQSSTRQGVGDTGPVTAPRRQSNTRRGFDDPGSNRPRKSRQPTLMGQATPKEIDAARDKALAASGKLSPPAEKQKQPSGIDWSAAVEAAQRPSAPPGLPLGPAAADDLDWGDDEDTMIANRPSAEAIAEAQARLEAMGKAMPSPLGDDEPAPPRPIAPARPLSAAELNQSSGRRQDSAPGAPGQPIAPAPPVAQAPSLDVQVDDDDDQATMIARSPLDDANDEIDKAMAMADSALDAMSGTISDEPTTTQDPPSQRMRQGSLLGSRKPKGSNPGAARTSSPSGPGIPPPRGSRPSGPGAPRGSSPSRPDLPPPRGSSPSRPGPTSSPDKVAKKMSEPGMPSELSHAMVEAEEPSTKRRGPESNEAVSVRSPVVISDDPSVDDLKATIADDPSVESLQETLVSDVGGDDMKATLALDEGIDSDIRAELDRAAAEAEAADETTERASAEEKANTRPEPRARAASEPVLDVTPPKTTSDAPPADSPWSKESDDAERERNEPVGQPISLLTSVLITLGTAALVMGAGIWWVRRSAQVTPPPMPVPTTPSPRVAPKEPVSAKPKPSASATTTASATATAPAKDPSKLPPTMGYLQVKWSGQEDAQIFLFGKSIGKVTERVELPCSGMQNVRVGTADRQWLSDGKPVKVGCQKLTELEIKPKK